MNRFSFLPVGSLEALRCNFDIEHRCSIDGIQIANGEHASFYFKKFHFCNGYLGYRGADVEAWLESRESVE